MNDKVHGKRCIDCMYCTLWNRTCEEHNKYLTHKNVMESIPIECKDYLHDPTKGEKNE